MQSDINIHAMGRLEVFLIDQGGGPRYTESTIDQAYPRRLGMPQICLLVPWPIEKEYSADMLMGYESGNLDMVIIVTLSSVTLKHARPCILMFLFSTQSLTSMHR